jgi:hypothetical protein
MSFSGKLISVDAMLPPIVIKREGTSKKPPRLPLSRMDTTIHTIPKRNPMIVPKSIGYSPLYQSDENSDISFYIPCFAIVNLLSAKFLAKIVLEPYRAQKEGKENRMSPIASKDQRFEK